MAAYIVDIDTISNILSLDLDFGPFPYIRVGDGNSPTLTNQ